MPRATVAICSGTMSRHEPINNPMHSPWLITILGGAIGTVIGGLVLNVIPGHPMIIGFVCATVVMVVIFLGWASWYRMILDYRNSADGSKARAAYNHLRSNLRGVNKPKDTPFGERYRNEIAKKLNGVAHWFGDADHPNSEGVCRQLGLDQAQPLWTPESYDRCLLLALFYPLACLFIFWVISGTIGPIEQALGLNAIENTRDRIGIAVGLLVIVLLCRQGYRSAIIMSGLCLLGAVTVAIAFSYVGVGVVAVAGLGLGLSLGVGVFAVAFAGVVTGAFLVAGAFFGADAIADAIADGGSGASIVTSSVFSVIVGFTFVVGFAVSFDVADRFASWVISIIRRVSYGAYSLLMVMGLAISPALLSHSEGWEATGPFLLFFGVLVFVNAPLDWLTLGVTRALLWRGVDRRGLTPIAWGLVDIGVALLLLVILSVVMILGIQLFNAAAVFGVRESVDQAIIDAAVFLKPANLVTGMANPATRGNPEYWWVYATLFSTLLPSWLHLLVASGCFVRGSTRLNQVIGNDLLRGKEGEPLLPTIHTKLAALLAAQRTFGLALATTVFIGGLWFVFFVLFPHILPRLLDLVIPLSGSDWATRFVNSIADIIGS